MCECVCITSQKDFKISEWIKCWLKMKTSLSKESSEKEGKKKQKERRQEGREGRQGKTRKV